MSGFSLTVPTYFFCSHAYKAATKPATATPSPAPANMPLLDAALVFPEAAAELELEPEPEDDEPHVAFVGMLLMFGEFAQTRWAKLMVSNRWLMSQ